MSISGFLISAIIALETSLKLCGGIFVAIPTAIPSEPLTSRFGKRDGKVILIDEIHTPDSSRYFYAEGYEERFNAGEPQKQLSKEFVRQWLIDNNFMGKEGQTMPEMTDEYCDSVSARYQELYEHITGEDFVKPAEEDLAARIDANVKTCLASLKR